MDWDLAAGRADNSRSQGAVHSSANVLGVSTGFAGEHACGVLAEGHAPTPRAC
jgi:hypothetical protein